MDMDLVNSAVGMKQAETMSRVQLAVAKKIMDVDKTNGAGVLKLIDAATSGVTQKGDALAAAVTGLSGELDTYA